MLFQKKEIGIYSRLVGFLFLLFVMIWVANTSVYGQEEMILKDEIPLTCENGIYKVTVSAYNFTKNLTRFCYEVNGVDAMGSKNLDAGKTKNFSCKVAVTEGSLCVDIPDNISADALEIKAVALEGNAPKKKKSIYFLGDSTTRYYEEDEERGGVGQGFLSALSSGTIGETTELEDTRYYATLTETDFLDVYNFSRSGQSTKTMLKTGVVNDLLCSIGEGDTVFIMLGHNDYLSENESIKTTPSQYRANLKKIIASVQAMKGIPVLVGPTNQYIYTSNGKAKRTLRSCENKMRKVATATGISYIDLGSVQRMYMNEVGSVVSERLFIYDYDGYDITHLTKYGAKVIGKMFGYLVLQDENLKDLHPYITLDYSPIVTAMVRTQKIKFSRYKAGSVRRFNIARRRALVYAFVRGNNSSVVYNYAQTIYQAKKYLVRKKSKS